jgi:hypothetical protein
VVVVPAVRLVCESELSVILPLLVDPPMVNGTVLLPPTDTLTVCAVVRQEAGIVAWSSLELRKVVPTVQLVPKLTRAPELNPDPNRVSKVAGEPTDALVGERELSVRLPLVPEPETVTNRVPEVPLETSLT